MSRYYNRRHQEAPKLKGGDKVYLLRKNIRTRRPNNKLDFKKIGPFEIDKQIGKVNFRLILPETMRIHPVFHIALLEPAPENVTTVQQTEEMVPENPDADENKDWIVEKVLDSGYVNDQFRYLLQWEGNWDNTWEPPENCDGCKELIAEFHRRNPKRPTPAPRSRGRPRNRTEIQPAPGQPARTTPAAQQDLESQQDPHRY